MEDLVVLGLEDLDQLHWGHFDYRFGVSGGPKSSEDIYGYNGHRCYRWRIDDQSVTMGSSHVRWDVGDFVQGVQLHYFSEGGLLETSLSLLVSMIPTSFIPSLPLLVIGDRLVREVLLCVDLSQRSRRSWVQSQNRLHWWWVISRSSSWGCKASRCPLHEFSEKVSP